MTAAGLRTELRVDGDPVPLAPGLDLSAYRIVQEALTNALRHTGPTRSRVTIRYLPGAVELEVLDDGGGPTWANGPGFGLTGIRERVALFGGTASTGARVEGGYAVRVRLSINRSDR
ncbi:MAG: ATP-binding protein [Marmoricola sp.]